MNEKEEEKKGCMREYVFLYLIIWKKIFVAKEYVRNCKDDLDFQKRKRKKNIINMPNKMGGIL